MNNQFGLIGKNINYSFSENYFKNKFEKLGLTHLSYQNFDIQDIEELKKILKENPNLKGLNVTIPYKESVVFYLDKINKKASKIGAVNCIKILKNGKLKGYNTDWIGFYETLKPQIQNHQKALVFGTGGASKAVVFALEKLNIKSLVVSRNNNGNQLNYNEIDENILTEYTLLINTTPVGTFPNITNCIDIPYQFVSKNHLAYDLIYNPEITLFLKKCSDSGAKIINGYQMLVIQAEKSYDIWLK